MSHKILLLGLAALAASGMKAQSEFTLINEAPANPDNEPVAVQPVPTERQILWNETEFYGFFHYGMTPSPVRSGATATKKSPPTLLRRCLTPNSGSVPSRLPA